MKLRQIVSAVLLALVLSTASLPAVTLYRPIEICSLETGFWASVVNNWNACPGSTWYRWRDRLADLGPF